MGHRQTTEVLHLRNSTVTSECTSPSTCIIVIKNDSIQVIHNGGNLTGTKGQILDQGVIRKHKKTAKWIIAHKAEDVEAKEIGGCSNGPTIIDFEKKVWWTC